LSIYDRVEERRTEYGIFRTFTTDKGKWYSHNDCERELKAAVRKTQRWFSRSIRTLTVWNDKDMRDMEIGDLRWVLEDITTYAEAVQQELDRIEGVDRKEERIKALRDVSGRTPEEAALYLRKAEELEGT